MCKIDIFTACLSAIVSILAGISFSISIVLNQANLAVYNNINYYDTCLNKFCDAMQNCVCLYNKIDYQYALLSVCISCFIISFAAFIFACYNARCCCKKENYERILG